MERFDPASVVQTKYLFFTGKGGVGKTSTACATAVYLADHGKRVLLVSTDPASNLQDVFSMALDRKGTEIPQAPGLFVANLDPIKAAEEYRENVVAAYRGVLPEAAIENMREQLSGSCTTEIAAFNEFSTIISSSIPRRQDIRCACCSYRPPGAASSSRASMELPASDSSPDWRTKESSMRRLSAPCRTEARRRCCS